MRMSPPILNIIKAALEILEIRKKSHGKLFYFINDTNFKVLAPFDISFRLKQILRILDLT